MSLPVYYIEQICLTFYIRVFQILYFIIFSLSLSLKCRRFLFITGITFLSDFIVNFHLAFKLVITSVSNGFIRLAS